MTGADGFVGRHLVDALAADQVPVRALDLHFATPAQPGIDQITADILDAEALRAATNGVDTVLHLAAISDLWVPPSDPARHNRVNVDGTRTVLSAAIAAGVRRFVYCSSNVTALAGSRRLQTIDETTQVPGPKLFGRYAASKHQAEQLVAAASDQIETIIAQPGTPIGPGDHRPTPPGLFLRDLANGAVPALPAPAFLNVVDVQVLAKALADSRYRGAAGSRYLLTGCDISLQDLAQIVANSTGLPAPRARVPYAVAWAAAFAEDQLWSRVTNRKPTASFDGLRMAGRARHFSNDRAQRDLSLAPTDLTRCVPRALHWMAQQGWITRDMPGLDAALASESARGPGDRQDSHGAAPNPN